MPTRNLIPRHEVAEWSNDYLQYPAREMDYHQIAPTHGWTRSCRGRARPCLVPGTIDFEAPTGTTDWDPVQWRGTTGNDRLGFQISEVRPRKSGVRNGPAWERPIRHVKSQDHDSSSGRGLGLRPKRFASDCTSGR